MMAQRVLSPCFGDAGLSALSKHLFCKKMREIALTKKKNNHFVPRSYLKRFSLDSKRQIALYNLRSDRTIPSAPIKSQCSRSYFYTRNPIFEAEFQRIEDRQLALLNRIDVSSAIPDRPTSDYRDLISCVMFQSGRTASTAAHFNHIANQYGMAILRHSFEKEGNTDLLAVLPQVSINTDGYIIDAIFEHLLMYPMIEDLDCTLFLNATSEDFLTSDHPVALCNGMPGIKLTERAVGFASRGLILLYPISPKMCLLFSDPEVYKIERSAQPQTLHTTRDVVELNLAQFGNAEENVYFADARRVQKTLAAFRKRVGVVRPPPPLLEEKTVTSADGQTGLFLGLRFVVRRLPLPKPIVIRHAAHSGRYKRGDLRTRDPERVRLVVGMSQEFRERRRRSPKQPKAGEKGHQDD